MAIFRGEIRSSVLHLDTPLNVILPNDKAPAPVTKPYKVLYLLHGYSDAANAWLRWTSIERYAMERGIAVVMPEVSHSFYADMMYGLPYFTYITEELPQMVRDMFQISGRKEDNFIAGLSMGGYGALKCALNFPERYAGVASFSGAADLEDIKKRHSDTPEHIREMQAIFGPEIKIPDNCNIHKLSERYAQASPDAMKLMISCGTDDFLFNQYLRLKEQWTKLGLCFKSYERPGAHTWDLWDEAVQIALDYFLA